MAQFLLRYGNPKIGKNRDLFVDPNNLTQKIILHNGKSVALTLTGLPANSAAPQIIVSKPNTIEISPLVKSKNDFHLTVKATGIGKVFFFAMGPNGSLTDSVHVVAGSFLNHSGMTEDLIADVYRSGDGPKMRALNRMLHNKPMNFFNENSVYNIDKHGSLACGTVAKVGGRDVFNPKTDYDYKDYYLPIPPITENGRKVWRVTSRDDVKYNEQKLRRGLNAIKTRLKQGLPVVAGLAYNPALSIDKFGYLQPTGTGGHSVLVVGANADATKLLYIDVYGPDGSGDAQFRGSILKYTGGPAGIDAFPDACEYLGIFELTTEPRGIVLKQRADTQAPGGMFDGTQFLEVVSGPLD